jgi:hypothetical protein
MSTTAPTPTPTPAPARPGPAPAPARPGRRPTEVLPAAASAPVRRSILRPALPASQDEGAPSKAGAARP